MSHLQLGVNHTLKSHPCREVLLALGVIPWEVWIVIGVQWQLGEVWVRIRCFFEESCLDGEEYNKFLNVRQAVSRVCFSFLSYWS